MSYEWTAAGLAIACIILAVDNWQLRRRIRKELSEIRKIVTAIDGIESQTKSMRSEIKEIKRRK